MGVAAVCVLVLLYSIFFGNADIMQDCDVKIPKLRYYRNNTPQIVVNEEERKNLSVGDEVIITILDRINRQKVETRAEKRRRLIELDAFVISSTNPLKSSVF